MATKYYYTSASLPMLLASDQKLPLTSDEFLIICQAFLTEPDYQGLLASSINPEGSIAPGICVDFRAWEARLRHHLLQLRAKEQGLGWQKWFRESNDFFGLFAIATHAMGLDSPLEAELYLDAQRWKKIEELETGHFFDIEYLRAYRLKIQILERGACFEEEKGFTAYRGIYDQVLQASLSDKPMGVSD